MEVRRKQIKGPSGKLVDGTIIDIDESTEKFSEVKLKDGTILKVKVVAFEAVRIDDQWDQEGNPMYVLKSQTVVSVSESPQHLREG